jgi:hypothetical protein
MKCSGSEDNEFIGSCVKCDNLLTKEAVVAKYNNLSIFVNGLGI